MATYYASQMHRNACFLMDIPTISNEETYLYSLPTTVTLGKQMDSRSVSLLHYQSIPIRWSRIGFSSRRSKTLSKDTCWSRDSDSPITAVRRTQGWAIFARGNCLLIKNFPEHLSILETIPHGPFTTEQLHEKLQGKISRDALSALVQQLVALGGFAFATTEHHDS